jgi:hypothetical protein
LGEEFHTSFFYVLFHLISFYLISFNPTLVQLSFEIS